MRAVLNAVYGLSAAVAGCAMVFVALIILAQITGRIFGVIVPSATELAGYGVAAMAFCSLAPTLQHGAHIRVTLILGKVPAGWRHMLEIGCLLLALGLSIELTYWLWKLVAESIHFHRVSEGLLPIPLWLPQLFMAIGSACLVIALLDNLVIVLRGGEPAYRAGETSGVSEENL